MDDVTPPKRVTRSKATTKNNIAESKVKIATAAGRAKATPNSVPTATKRKTRADEGLRETNDKDINNETMNEDAVRPKLTRGRKKTVAIESEGETVRDEKDLVNAHTIIKSTRGRPKKIIEEAPPVEAPKATRSRARKAELPEEHPQDASSLIDSSKPVRGRSKKSQLMEEPLTEEMGQSPPTKSVRGRPKKTEVIEERSFEEVPPAEQTKSARGRPKRAEIIDEPSTEIAPELVRKPRGRPIAVSKIGTVSKKSVKFEEEQGQDKENIVPDVVAKGRSKEAETATGLKAKPVRRPAVGTRTMRGRSNTTASDEKLPLTPKKATQIATAKGNVSDDELSTMEKTPMKLLTKSPVKMHGSTFGAADRMNLTASVIANRAVTQDFSASIMGSPARRPMPSPYKDSLKTSPKRVNLGDTVLRSPLKFSMQQTKPPTTPLKASLLKSPAKRPQSPMKVPNLLSPSRARFGMGETSKFNSSRFEATPRTSTKSSAPSIRSLSGGTSIQAVEETSLAHSNLNPTTIRPFPGRLSSIVPREVDPVMHGTTASMEIAPNNGVIQEENEMIADPVNGDPMILDSNPQDIDMTFEDVQSTTPISSPPRYSIGSFSLRDEDPFQNSESEDELASGSPKYSPAPLNIFSISSQDFALPATSTPAQPIHKMPQTAVAYISVAEEQHNATYSQPVKLRKDHAERPRLSRQSSDWMYAAGESSSSSDEEGNRSSIRYKTEQDSEPHVNAPVQLSPAKSTFFEDAMTSEKVANSSAPDTLSAEFNDNIDALSFAPATLDEEDLALAAEADEMSLIAVETFDDAVQSVDVLSRSISGDMRALSEASQEYADENVAPDCSNQMPIYPALLALDARDQVAKSVPDNPSIISTPVRILGERERVFHTVSKVPLKPAGADSPLKIDKRCASASRMPQQRKAQLPHSFTVPKLPSFEQGTILTPTRSDIWSAAGTQVRTPRRNQHEQVLKGAVVFVDVHTTEGADASAVFVELLGQMGARCVKAWNWNPNNSNGPETAWADQIENELANKIGITHVVFKDGGKRTLEKVRESKGFVLCVGVGWVLDCERQQLWLPESPYTIDTAVVPRGGHRRRKSMEPRSIQNLNGTLSVLPNSNGTPRSISASYAISPTKEFLSLSDTPGTGSRSARRKSTLWIRSPSSDGEPNEDADVGLMLSPVPATPAPEIVSAYAEHVLDTATPDGAATPYFLQREQLVQRTCPPKSGLVDGEGTVGFQFGDVNEEDSGNVKGSGVLLQRLMLARRKSLQWAPKVGSPLAKASFGA